MNVTKNITIEEATISGTAKRLNINNLPTKKDVLLNIEQTCKALEELNSHLTNEGFIIQISSLYRSPAVNKAVGGSKTSAHMTGLAADIKSTKHTPQQLFKKIYELVKSGKIKSIDQVILEPSWVHFGIRKNRVNERKAFLVKRARAYTAPTAAELQ